MKLKLPNHLAIIMDGNGRWAQSKKKPRVFGHVKGTRVAKEIITECSKMGIKYLTLYAFSTENWFRPKEEVSFLMKILRRYLTRETQNLVKENIKFSVIGDMSKLPNDVISSINTAMAATNNCKGLNLIFALNYGSRQEIANAFFKIYEKINLGIYDQVEISPEMISENLFTAGTPDPDLIIRTSGEQRLSNFLLWQAAYAEFYFTDTLWPDFKKNNLVIALDAYSQRHRRYGKLDKINEVTSH